MLSLLLFSAINLGALQGIDCSGQTDSSAALNALFTHISNQTVDFSGCTMRVDKPLTIYGQSGFVLQGGSERPNQGSGDSIAGCNGSAGPVLTISRSGWWRISGLGIYAKKNDCASNFTKGIVIANSADPGGVTTTEGIIEHSFVTSSTGGTPIPGYVGIEVTAPNGNGEHMVFHENGIYCQNSLGSLGIHIASNTSDNDLAESNSIYGCYMGIRQDGGNIRIVHNHFGGNGNFSVFGAKGAAIGLFYITSGPEYIAYNELSENGPFLNNCNDMPCNFGGILYGINIIGNELGISDMSKTDYPINVGVSPVPYILIGNDVKITQMGVTKTVIGSDSQLNCKFGPLGKLIDIGNTNSLPQNTAGWSGCPGGHDFQGGHTTY